MKKTKRSTVWAKEKIKKSIGIHLVADFYSGKIIESSKELRKVLISAAKKAGSTPLKISIHKFYPRGITGVLLLAESHIAVHSWPEYNFLAIDIFTCGKNSIPEKALEFLKIVFKPKKIKVLKIERGKIR